ncbi:HAD-IIB family hydrolase [Candidatus Woesearchaeota archaeon]|nr:HAD-IIB family hydrolase [Candidatus Woesearchaeota archaeon]
MKTIIITDMDGCFLDHHNYSFSKSLPAYRKAKKQDIPVCFCTSKTFQEIRYYQKNLDIHDPFIAENGAAIYIPKDYFSFNLTKLKFPKKLKPSSIIPYKGYTAVELNVRHKETLAALKRIQKKLNFHAKIFSEHTPKEIHKLINLPIVQAKLSLKKNHSDGFLIPNMDNKKIAAFKKATKELGFTPNIGGRAVGITKGSDKGKATELLLHLFRKEYGRIHSIGLGDSYNDLPMLRKVKSGFLVQRPDKKCIKAPKHVKHINKIGPEGWNYAIMQFLKNRS